LTFVPVGLRVLSWQDEQPTNLDLDDVRVGKVLFTHEWEPNDPLSAGGDGLGPVFNAKSCAACHNQGGLGGGGDVDHNVTTFLIDGRNGQFKEGVIHAFAVSGEYMETLNLLSPDLPAISQPTLPQLVHMRRPRNCQPIQAPDGIHLAQRNTPALFGAGLIDSIPDRVILANMKWQRLRHGLAPGDTNKIPVGRANRLADGRVGKFGWKGQSARLADFVQAACANELGLGNPGHAQPQSLRKQDFRKVGYDLTQKQCDQITAFVAALPRPEERLPADAEGKADAARGKALFRQSGCAACHTPDLGSVSGIYSDLLLHRMSEELESGGSSYGGEPPPRRSIAKKPSGPRPEEWRTPPLWGVADSGPYLHDGRAATLEEAILKHGGQGARAARNFERLSQRQQARLVAFLKTLRAPERR
jgi:CxxC motif-containing protein (DUF1111 family)